MQPPRRLGPRQVAALRRTAPVVAVGLCAVAIVAGGPLYPLFVLMLVALAVTAATTAGWPALAALAVALLAPFRSVPTLDRGVLLACVSALVWTALRWRARARDLQARRAAAEH